MPESPLCLGAALEEPTCPGGPGGFRLPSCSVWAQEQLVQVPVFFRRAGSPLALQEVRAAGLPGGPGVRAGLHAFTFPPPPQCSLILVVLMPT